MRQRPKLPTGTLGRGRAMTSEQAVEYALSE